VPIQRVLTDNANAYADSVAVAETAARLGIARKRTRPYRPQTNGKVERSHKTLADAWADGRLYRSNAERCRAWPGGCGSTITGDHTSLDDLTPIAVLVNNLHGKHT
jgi:transposase InsO family protein